MRITIFLALFVLVTSNLHALSSKKLAIAINLCGKERMLSQRLTKEALLIYKGIDVEKNREILKKDFKLFQSILLGLKNGDKKLKLKATKDMKILDKLDKVNKVWVEFKKHIKNILNSHDSSNLKKDIEFLLKSKDTLLNRANDAVVAYVAKSKKNTSKRAQSVNLSGKLRMLTQKLSIEILQNNPKQKETIQKMDKILNGLKYGDIELNLQKTKLPNISKKLDSIRSKFEIIKKSNDENQKLNMLNKLLTQIDKMTKLYAISINRERVSREIGSLVQDFTNEKSKKRKVINIAGRQRMLTQRIAKDLILDKYNHKYNNDLIYSKKLFMDSLNLLKTKDKNTLNMVKSIEKIYNKFEQSKSLKEKLILSDKLLSKSQALVLKYKKLYKSKNFIENTRLNIVDIAGRERMLSQKMTKALFAKINSLKFKDFDKELKNSCNLFEDSLHSLIKGDRKMGIIKPTNEKIISQLNKVEMLWKKIKPYYKKNNLSNAEIKSLVPKNLELLKEMDKGVKLCAKELEY